LQPNPAISVIRKIRGRFLLLVNGQRNYPAFPKAATDFTDFTDLDA
jgi:hypothetical protein